MKGRLYYIGYKAICKQLNCTENTARKFISEKGFPKAEKLYFIGKLHYLAWDKKKVDTWVSANRLWLAKERRGRLKGSKNTKKVQVTRG